MPSMIAVLTVIAVGALLLTERNRPRARPLAKTTASTGFVALAWSVGAFDSGYGRWVLAALALCWAGDLFLLGTSRRLFLAGLLVFLAGHIAYVAAFWVRGLALGWVVSASIGVAVVSGAAFRWLQPYLGAMRVPVVAYVIVISAMVAAASGTIGFDFDTRILPGAVAFYASDLAVARNRFVAPGFVNRLWGLPLYYGGQLLLAWSSGG